MANRVVAAAAAAVAAAAAAWLLRRRRRVSTPLLDSPPSQSPAAIPREVDDVEATARAVRTEGVCIMRSALESAEVASLRERLASIEPRKKQNRRAGRWEHVHTPTDAVFVELAAHATIASAVRAQYSHPPSVVRSCGTLDPGDPGARAARTEALPREVWSPPLPPGRGHAGALSRRRHPRDTAAQIRSVPQTWHMDTPHLFACKCADANPALSHPYLSPRHRRAPWPRDPVAWRTGAHWSVGRTYHLILSLSLFHSSTSFPPTARPSSSSAHTSRPT